MKKLVCALFAITLSLSAFAGEKFESILGFGLSVPVSKTTYSYNSIDTDVSQFAIGADISWVGIIKDLGLAFKADAFIGGVSSDDADSFYKGYDKEICAELAFDAGAGYAFCLEKFTLGLFGMLGFGLDTYNYTRSVNNTDVKSSIGAGYFEFGADIFANYKLVNKLGLFADLGIRGLFGKGNTRTEMNGSKTTTEPDFKGFKFTPTIGLSLNF